MARALSQHPAVKALEVKRKVSEKAIDLAKQQYKPQWGGNANYGYRDDMPSGQSRADFFSVGVSFDVPLFTKNDKTKKSPPLWQILKQSKQKNCCSPKKC
ncbi:TolC family protein [Alteromonas sp. MB-3u-76]|uniref:TolC family protein n=1 Tax=Alteromonas sp. MB-3u-76 TaxID=2058133 RepID=UPI001E5AA278|nr:TolC family protein [Alteromonas sp. MB-3u-76]